MSARGVWRLSDGSDELVLVDSGSADPEGDPAAAPAALATPALTRFGVTGGELSTSRVEALETEEAAFRIERILPDRGADGEILEAARSVAAAVYLPAEGAEGARAVPPREGAAPPGPRLRKLLLQGLRSGRLRLFRIVPLLLGSEGAAEAEPAPHEASPRVKKTWIEVVLMDEAGWAVPNERFRIELPDGSTREGRLNAEGYVRVEGIDPGECEVTFPDLDEEAWERIGA